MIEDVFLHPGEFYFADGPARIRTILGSCVAFTMKDPVSGRAAMCHCLLPEMPTGKTPQDMQLDKFRYVDTSLVAMLQELQRCGVPAGRLDIKLFGGANVLTKISKERAVGSMNWKQAEKCMEKFSLALRARDVGGEAGRRILFETVSGEVFVKLLRTASQAETAIRKVVGYGEKA